MMEQYLGVKAKYPDTLLLYRMGDFYETFYEDAVTLSRVLGIVLTSRSPGDAEKIPLAGIPWHSAEPQIARLLQAGLKVAICEQVEGASEAKGLIARRVVEVLSPGTAVTDPLLERNRNNFLVAISGDEERIGLSAADISTGIFLAGDLTEEEAEEELARLAPSEILWPEGWKSARLEKFLTEYLPEAHRTSLDPWRFDPSRGAVLLREHFRVASLEGYGFRDPTFAVGAAAAVLEYAREQKQAPLTHMNGIERIQPAGHLLLDEASLRGLEVLEPLSGGGKDSTLLSVLDRTRTAAGGRRLRDALSRPFRDPEPARERCDRVASLIEDARARLRVAEELAGVSDIERILGRIHCGRAAPRDLVGLMRSLLAAPRIVEDLAELNGWNEAAFPAECRLLAKDLEAALAEPPPATVRDGEVFRDGYDAELDSIREAARGGRRWMADTEAKERESTGISNLKVGYNRVFGYYIEVTRSQLSRVPDRYHRKQTLSTGERYVTPELKEQEERILGAQEAEVRRQEELFRALCERAAAATVPLQNLARLLAEADLTASFAEVAAASGYARPVLDRSRALEIEEGPPSGRRAGGGDRHLRAERHLSRFRGPAGRHPDRPEHGRQVDVPPPDRPDRPHGAGGILRPRQGGADRRRRPDLHAGWRSRCPLPRPIDLPGRDDRDGEHPPPRDVRECRSDGRGGTRHLDLRRRFHRVGRCGGTT